jgi:tRNA threonylcarbamoyladenosine modification (KEOPS) complex Cgi121 subunit
MSYDISGCKGRIDDVEAVIAELKRLGEQYGVVIQLFNARLVYGAKHLESSILHAERSFSTNTNLAGDMAVEILLYSSGERQIALAIKKMGIKKDCQEFGMVLCCKPGTGQDTDLGEIRDEVLKELSLERDDGVLDGSMDVLVRFGIEEDEIGSVPESNRGNIILSRVAMVDVIK